MLILPKVAVPPTTKLPVTPTPPAKLWRANQVLLAPRLSAKVLLVVLRVKPTPAK